MIDKSELEKAFDSRFPKEIKEKLSNSRVAVAGIGGLGSNITVMLARSGVGHLFLVDFDMVDITNINRQAYMIQHIGMKKTDAIQEILKGINPYLDIKTCCIKVNSENAEELFKDYPILCEAFDNAQQKAMLISSVLTKCKDTTIVSGNGMAGFGNSNDIKTQKRLNRLYICGDDSTDIGDGMGLMSPRVSICAGHQANKVIQLILNGE